MFEILKQYEKIIQNFEKELPFASRTTPQVRV